MLYPKKVKHRKWFTKRKHPVKEANKHETRGVTVDFGSFGLKAMEYGRITSNQIESARKAAVHYAGKNGKMWTRIFPDMPFTQKPAEVKMGKGKGEPVGFVAEVRPGRIMFELDGVDQEVATEALRKAGTKLPISTKVVSRM
jgi:large subunit ribosomal protein L16